MLLPLLINAQDQSKKNNGIRFSVQAGASLDLKNSAGENLDKSMYSTNIRLGMNYFIIPEVSVGGGIGLENFQNPVTTAYPLFFNANYYIFNARNTPFIYGSAGTLLKLNNNAQKGTMADLGVGYKFFAGDKICLNVTIGYSHRNLKNLNISEYKSNAISLGLGMIF